MIITLIFRFLNLFYKSFMMIRILALLFFTFISFIVRAQNNTFIFLNSKNELYSISVDKAGNTCGTPVSITSCAGTNPLSITLFNNILYYNDNAGNLYSSTYDSTLQSLTKCKKVGVFTFTNKKGGYGLTVDSKGIVYGASANEIQTYDPTKGTFSALHKINSKWTIAGDLLFWGGHLYEACTDSTIKTAVRQIMVQVDTAKYTSNSIYLTFKTALTKTDEVFGIASVKVPCQYNQVFALTQGGDVFSIDMYAKKEDSLKAVCSISGLGTINDAASTAEGGLENRPAAPTPNAPNNNICVGKPFDFAKDSAILLSNPNDTFAWSKYPTLPGTVPTGLPTDSVKGSPYNPLNFSSYVVSSYHYLVVSIGKTSSCPSTPVDIYLDVHPYPKKPTITPMIDTVCSASKLVSDTLSNQWYFNKVLINGANAINYSATATGSYYDIVTNQWGCATASDTARIKILGVSFSYAGSPYCNSGLSTVTKSGDSVGGKFSAPLGLVIDSITGTIDLGKSTPGTYTVTYTLNCSLSNCTYTTSVSVHSTAATIKYASDSFCQVQPIQNVTLAGTGTITGGVYTSTPVGLTLNSSTGDITPSSSLFGNYQIVYTYTDPICGTFHDTTNVSIVDKVTPQITITASADTICTGTPVTFTATPVNGGTAPSYQWYKNGTLISGAINNTYIDAALINADVISCALVSNAPCLANANAASNTIKIVVNTFSPSISIAGTSTFCVGTSVTFNATATSAGKTPNYQWQVNSSNVGSNTSTFTSTTLNNNDTVTCILSGVPTCSTTLIDTSNKLVMVVNVPTVSNTIAKICTGDSYSFNGTNYNTTGVYTIHLTNSKGCDSAATLNLTVNQPSTSTTTASICAGTTYSFNGKVYNTSGTFITHLTNSVGCDSAATLVLTIKATSTSTTTASICDKSSYVFNGSTYTTAGTYVAHLTNAIGCDSAATLILTVNKPTTSTTNKEICNGDSYIFNGTSYNTAGTYIAHLANSVGCDSAASLVLTVSQKLTADLITGPTSVDIGQTIQLVTLTTNTPNGAWISEYPTIATIDFSSGLVTGVSNGADSIFYVVSNACGSDSAKYKIRVIPPYVFIPNTFSPRGSGGPNEVFYVRGDPMAKMELRIFDSWGYEIFMSKGQVNDPNQGWKGTFNGKAQPPGVYVFVARIEMTSGEIQIKKGAINLIR